MAGSYQPKHLLSSLKSSSTTTSSSTINSMKLKTIVQSFIFSHLYRVIRALAKAKSILFQLVKNVHLVHLVEFPMLKKNKNKNDKLFLGSFRLHYNWCSSHVMPVPVPMPTSLEDCSTGHVYYDSTWNSIISTACDESELSGYLQWLEENANSDNNSNNNNNNNNANNGNDIDKLADMFIANCHERFRLEKVESYRRFQEMLARSV